MSVAGYEWWPREHVTHSPRGTYVEVVRDCWWLTNENGEILFYRMGDGGIAPQCNRSPEIVRRILKRPGVPEASLIYLPLAFSPIRIEDYR